MHAYSLCTSGKKNAGDSTCVSHLIDQRSETATASPTTVQQALRSYQPLLSGQLSLWPQPFQQS